MRLAAFVAPAIVALLVLSGCVDPTETKEQQQARRAGQIGTALPISDGWAEAVFAVDDDHNHKDFAQHVGLTTSNFQVIGHDPLTTDYHGKSAGGYFCADVREGGDRRLSVVHSWVSDVAYVISDVSDPLNPKKIGEFVMANTHVYDLALTPDQNWVLLSTSPGTNSVGEDPMEDDAMYAPGDILFRDACSGETKIVDGPEQGLPFSSGLVLVDITNPRNPSIADFRHIPVTGGHSVRVENVDGSDLILISTTSGLPQVGNPTGYYLTAAYWFMDFIDSPAGRKLNFLSHYQYPAKPAPVPQLQVPSSLHDGFIQKHPVTGTWLAYLAAGDSGLAILDITDPMLPTLIGTWNDWTAFGEGAPPGQPFVHEALPLETTWDGRHYTFIGEECGPRPNTPTCLVAMLDTTDPANIEFVSGWTLPFMVQSQGAMYSLHYLAIQNRTLFVSAYHAGVWAVDVSTPEAIRTMPSIGAFMPEIPPPKGTVYPDHVYHYTPIVMDVLPLSDGNMIVYDGTSGLYVVKFDHSNPAPSPDPWPFPFNQ